MTPPQQRRGKAGPARQEKIQDRPAEPAVRRPVLDPGNRDGEFLPNPQPAKKEAPGDLARDYDLRVTGPKEVGGVQAPGKVTLTLTPGQLDALTFGGHVEPWTEPEPEDPPAQDEGDSPNEEGN